MRHLGEIRWTEGSGVVLADSKAAAQWTDEDTRFLYDPGFFDGRRGRECTVGATPFVMWFAIHDNSIDVWRIDDRTVRLQQCFLDDYSDPERAVPLVRRLAELEVTSADRIGTVVVSVPSVVAFPSTLEWVEIADQVIPGGDGVELSTPFGERDGGVQFKLPVGSYACFASSFEWKGCEVERLTLGPAGQPDMA